MRQCYLGLLGVGQMGLLGVRELRYMRKQSRPVRPVRPVCVGFAALGAGGRLISRQLRPVGLFKRQPPPDRHHLLGFPAPTGRNGGTAACGML